MKYLINIINMNILLKIYVYILKYIVRFMSFKSKTGSFKEIFCSFWVFFCLLRDILVRKFINIDLGIKINVLIRVCC